MRVPVHFIFILWKGFIFIIICLTVCSIVLINNVFCTVGIIRFD